MEDTFVLDPELSEEDRKDNILRPKRLEDFIGQRELTDNLRIFINAALQREESLDHIFLSGPPGLGKTTLASIIAHEMNAELKVTSAPALDKPKDLAGILTTLSPHSVLFIDEIHRMRSVVEEMLYVAMEDYEIDWIIGQGPSARTVRIPVPPFTLVAATTKAGMVSSPLFTRFGIPSRFDYYSNEDLAYIIRRSAGILDVHIDEEASLLLASCSRGTPRIANRLLKRMRDFAQVLGDGTLSRHIVSKGLQRLRIDQNGLEDHDRRILRVIIENYGGGPVGADTLAISVGESADTLEDFYEPFLIQKGLLQRTPRGRMVTPKAYELLGIERNTKTNGNQGLLF